MIRPRSTVLAALAAILLLAACDLPQGAGREDQILSGATDADADFAVQPVTRASLPMISGWPLRGEGAGGWIGHSRGPAGQIIEPGDKLDVVIWANDESSLLANPGQKSVPISALQVSQSGTIFLPYVSEVYVAKMSPEAARDAIQQKLLAISPSAQVQLSMASGRQNSVEVLRGVAQPGPFALLDRNTTILSVLAQAGGVPESIENPQVRLIRDGRTYGISLDRLMSTPSLDTTLRGGDKIFVEPDGRFFLTFGASGLEARIRFPSDRLTAMEAMSMTGGADELRANPAAIFILRSYGANAVRAEGAGPPKRDMIFTFDLTGADGIFAAGQFQLQDQDVVVVSESPVTAARTVFALLASLIAVNAAVQ